MTKWFISIIALLLCLDLWAQQPGTIVIRKKIPVTDSIEIARADTDEKFYPDEFEIDSFYTRDNPHLIGVFGTFNREGYTLFNNFGARYGYYVMPYIAMGVDFERKYYRHIYDGPTIGPFIRFEYYVTVARWTTIGLFAELDYQIALLKPSPIAESSLGYREADFGFGFSLLRWYDRGISIDFKGSYIYKTSEAAYDRYGRMAPSIRLNLHF